MNAVKQSIQDAARAAGLSTRQYHAIRSSKLRKAIQHARALWELDLEEDLMNQLSVIRTGKGLIRWDSYQDKRTKTIHLHMAISDRPNGLYSEKLKETHDSEPLSNLEQG